MSTDSKPLDPSSPGAWSPSGKKWWEQGATSPTGKPLGDGPRIAAWLRFHIKIGDFFTMDQIRAALGLSHEHDQRRLRELRKNGWEFPSGKQSTEVGAEGYRLDQYGWWPGEGKRPNSGGVSLRVRRLVMERDGSRCAICGVGAGEPYQDDPASKAVMTIGHVRPGSFAGSNQPDNLRVECAHCNEPVRNATGQPEDCAGVIVRFDNLGKQDKQKLASWVAQGHRGRDDVDDLYDRVRRLSPGDLGHFKDHIKQVLGENAL